MKFKYLKHIELPYNFRESSWSICPFTGALLKSKPLDEVPQTIPLKILNALEYCESPYLLKSNHEKHISPIDLTLITSLNKMHERLLKIDNSRFYLTRLYSSIKHDIFDTTSLSMIYINMIPQQIEQRHRLCLQKSFLASKISKGFVENGVLFIGAFLPTGDMHAWIIENDIQPDIEDRGWVNYRPLLAFYH